MTRTRASIVMATRNRLPQLKLGVGSIVDMHYKDTELVVVDDGSTDGTDDYVKGLGDMMPRGHGPIVYSQMPRDGGYRSNPSVPINKAHELATADVFIHTSPEVVHVTRCVDPLLTVCEPGVVAIATVFDGTESVLASFRTVVDQYTDRTHWSPGNPITDGNSVPPAVVNVGGYNFRQFTGRHRPAAFMFLGAIHRKDWEAVGGLDETISKNNDGDLADRLLAAGTRFVFVDEAIAFHLQHGKS